MRKNQKGVALTSLIIIIAILIAIAVVVVRHYFVGDNGVVSNVMKMDVETVEAEVRDYFIKLLNEEVVCASDSIKNTTTDISAKYNEIQLINFLAGHQNFAETEHEDTSAVLCIENLDTAKQITPKGGSKEYLSEENVKDLIEKKLLTEDGKIYNQYRVMPKAFSEEMASYGKGKKIEEGDIFVIEAVTEEGEKITEENAQSTGKYQLIYYDKDKKAHVLETVSLYMTNQS